jgi:hypothetical protein
LTQLIAEEAPHAADASLGKIAVEAVRLGGRLRGTEEGNVIAAQMFALVRKIGGRLSLATVLSLVLRGESYSRTGLVALGMLYDDYFEHIRSMGLPALLTSHHPEVGYYCAYREGHPTSNSSDITTNPGEFTFAKLKYVQWRLGLVSIKVESHGTFEHRPV